MQQLTHKYYWNSISNVNSISYIPVKNLRMRLEVNSKIAYTMGNSFREKGDITGNKMANIIRWYRGHCCLRERVFNDTRFFKRLTQDVENLFLNRNIAYLSRMIFVIFAESIMCDLNGNPIYPFDLWTLSNKGVEMLYYYIFHFCLVLLKSIYN